MFGDGQNPDKIKVLEAITLTDGVAGNYYEISGLPKFLNAIGKGYGVFAIVSGRLCFDRSSIQWGALVPIMDVDSGVFKKEDVDKTLKYDALVNKGVVYNSWCFTSGNL